MSAEFRPLNVTDRAESASSSVSSLPPSPGILAPQVSESSSNGMTTGGRKSTIMFLGSPAQVPREIGPLPHFDGAKDAILNRRSGVPLMNPDDTFDPDNPQIRHDVIRMIAQYLRNVGYHSSAGVLADEAQLEIADQATRRTQIKQLKRYVLDGDWEAAHKLVAKVCSRTFLKRTQFAMYRQEFFELLQKQESQRAFLLLNKRLKPLEDQASTVEFTPVHSHSDSDSGIVKDEFMQMCYLLSCKTLTDSSMFNIWAGVDGGREIVSNQVALLVRSKKAFDADSMACSSKHLPDNRLVTLLQQSAAYQIESSRYRAKVPPKLTSLLSDYSCVACPNSIHRLFKGHVGPVRAVEFVGQRGQYLAAGGSDGRVLIWPTEPDGAFDDLSVDPMIELACHSSKVWDIASTKSGSHMASVDAKGVLNVTKLPQDIPKAHLEDEAPVVVCLNTCTSTESTDSVSSLRLPAPDLYSVAWHPGENHIITGGHDKRIHLVDMHGGTLNVVRTLTGHEAPITQLSFNTAGNLAMSASRDGSVRFWDMLSGINVKTLNNPALMGDITSASLSEQGTLLLTMPKHGPIRLWDLRNLDRPLHRFTGHQNARYSFIRCAFAGDDSLVMSGSDDGRVHVWETDTGNQFSTLQGHRAPVFQATWSKTQGLIASCANNGTVLSWAWDGSVGREEPSLCKTPPLGNGKA